MGASARHRCGARLVVSLRPRIGASGTQRVPGATGNANPSPVQAKALQPRTAPRHETWRPPARRPPAAPATTLATVEGIHHGDNLELLGKLPDGCVQMAYADPPFNTGRTQTRRTVTTVAASAEAGDRTGFGGRRYATTTLATSSYADAFDDYLGFLEPRLRELRRVLHESGTLYLHLDYREAHAAKLLLDEIFGRECFLNELIWAYDYGAKPKSRWPQKHDTILVYVKDRGRYFFDGDAVEREPYMAPGLVTPEKAARG